MAKEKNDAGGGTYDDGDEDGSLPVVPDTVSTRFRFLVLSLASSVPSSLSARFSSCLIGADGCVECDTGWTAVGAAVIDDAAESSTCRVSSSSSES